MVDADAATAGLAGLIDTLRELPQGVDDAVRIDRIRVLEELKAVASAVQALEAAAFAASQRAAQRAAGVAEKQVGRGIPGQVGLARRESPYRAARYLGWAAILTSELPKTFAALHAGRTSEWRALIVARETAWLSREHRLTVDAELAPRLERPGDRQVEAETKKLGYRLDPEGAVERMRNADADRHVSLRPAPDTMTRLSALLPVAQGVAVYAALKRAADTHSPADESDRRGRGQIMADTLVERVTGLAAAPDVPLTVNLIMTDQTLLDSGDEPAHLDGYGPLPAPAARDLITRPADSTPMWLRRLFIAPGTGQLISMESAARFFSPGQRRFVAFRDQYCRTPYCGAPIRHADHVHPAEDGGRTTVRNGQGYCETCNHTKQAPGWTTRVIDNDDGVHEVETITPTGHRYRSRAPDPPRRPEPDDERAHASTGSAAPG